MKPASPDPAQRVENDQQESVENEVKINAELAEGLPRKRPSENELEADEFVIERAEQKVPRLESNLLSLPFPTFPGSMQSPWNLLNPLWHQSSIVRKNDQMKKFQEEQEQRRAAWSAELDAKRAEWRKRMDDMRAQREADAEARAAEFRARNQARNQQRINVLALARARLRDEIAARAEDRAELDAQVIALAQARIEIDQKLREIQELTQKNLSLNEDLIKEKEEHLKTTSLLTKANENLASKDQEIEKLKSISDLIETLQKLKIQKEDKSERVDALEAILQEVPSAGVQIQETGEMEMKN